MGIRVQLDRRAIADLEDIRDYLLQFSPTSAERVRQHIAHTLDALADFPFLCRPTDEPDVRVLPLTRYPYLIFYTAQPDKVVVLPVRHAARAPLDPRDL